MARGGYLGEFELMVVLALIRLGTPALTTRGLTEEHMPQVAAWMDDAITAFVVGEDELVLPMVPPGGANREMIGGEANAVL